MCDLADDRDRQGSLGTEDPTQYRESKIQGSAVFGDDRDGEADPGEQSRLTPDGDDRQRTLDGDTAAEAPEWSG